MDAKSMVYGLRNRSDLHRLEEGFPYLEYARVMSRPRLREGR